MKISEFLKIMLILPKLPTIMIFKDRHLAQSLWLANKK
jgi:hypothetical protein